MFVSFKSYVTDVTSGAGTISLPGHLSSRHLGGSCCTIFCCLFSVLQIDPVVFFFFLHLYCLFVFYLRFLITALVSSALASNTNQLKLTANRENIRKREDVLRAVASLSTNIIHLFSCPFSV